MKKLVYGVGNNDAGYAVSRRKVIGHVNGKPKEKLLWYCPFYRTWKNMLERCFSKRWKIASPTYEDITCCQEWLTFSNFKMWMEQQDWEGKQLDKDIIVFGNKVYSPETCAFVFGTPEEAHEAWRKRKHEHAQLIAETEVDLRVVEALKKRYSPEVWYERKA